MIELGVALIGMAGVVLAAWLPLRERRQDRRLASEMKEAKNTELEILRTQLADCQENREWLRSQITSARTSE